MSLIFNNNEYNNILENINKNKDNNKDNECAICRDPLLVDTIDLNCKHRYHTECLLNSYVKYESKKCPLCNDHFLIDTYKSTCIKTMKDNKICNKLCYNNEHLCKIHIKTYLKELEKNSNKTDKTKNNKVQKLIKSKKLKLEKLNKQVNDMQSEITLLERSLIDI
mgnify:CR=1|jgi:hypothetical protein